MSASQNAAWKTRLVENGFRDRSFDIEFWQEQGDEAIFSAEWELVELAEEVSEGRKPGLRRLLQLFNEFEVEYLIVGGFAVMKYGEPRYTKDLDVWANNSAQNSLRLVEALKKFGVPGWDYSRDIHGKAGCLSDWTCTSTNRHSDRDHRR